MESLDELMVGIKGQVEEWEEVAVGDHAFRGYKDTAQDVPGQPGEDAVPAGRGHGSAQR